MKKALTITAITGKCQRAFLSAVLLITLLLTGNGLFAQTDSTKKEEPAVDKESTMLSPSLELISVQKSDNSIDLKTAMRAKFKGSSLKLAFLKVTFVQVVDTAEKNLGFVITDKVGKAVLNIKANTLVPDKEGKLHFKAMFAGNKSMETADAEVTVKRALLAIEPLKEDSTISVKIKLTDMGTGTGTPVAKTTVGIYVKRMFFPLKIGEGTTDDAGEATVEVPKNLPGDPKGNITLIAKVDENELYGNLEASTVQAWGTPVSDEFKQLPRALWSTHPPIWMLITFAVLITAVWGHYIVIIYELIRLRKEQPHQDPETAIT